MSTRARRSVDVAWHQADLLDADQASMLVSQIRPSHLLHLAWTVTPGLRTTSAANLQWVNASLSLLEAFGANGGQRVVMVGTGIEYQPTDRACSETTPLGPTSLYGACKAGLSVMLPAFGERYGVRSTAWARLFNLYGPREHPDRLVPSAIRALLQGQTMPCTHGEQTLDYLYVEDAADGLVALLDADVTGCVNVASGQPRTVRSILSAIGDRLGGGPLLQFGALATRPDEPRMHVADVSRAAQDVKWAPKIGLDEGLERTIAWWRGQVE